MLFLELRRVGNMQSAQNPNPEPYSIQSEYRRPKSRRWALLHPASWAYLAPFLGRYSGAPDWFGLCAVLLSTDSFGNFVRWATENDT